MWKTSNVYRRESENQHEICTHQEHIYQACNWSCQSRRWGIDRTKCNGNNGQGTTEHQVNFREKFRLGLGLGLG